MVRVTVIWSPSLVGKTITERIGSGRDALSRGGDRDRELRPRPAREVESEGRAADIILFYFILF